MEEKNKKENNKKTNNKSEEIIGEKENEELEVEDEGQKLKECQKKRDEYLAGWQRTQADFLNYKKKESERLKEFSEYANLSLVLKILPILDNLDLIEKNLSEELKNNENIKGVLQIKTQVLDFLKNQKIEKIKVVGEKFDPNFHEAIEQVEIEGKESGIIIEEVQKGYKLRSMVIRPAKVRVTK